MRAGVLSARGWNVPDIRQVVEQKLPVQSVQHAASQWNLESFAEAQIRGLVHRVFSADLNPPVQQVVFSAVEPETKVWSLCTWVAEILSQERIGDIAVVDESQLGPRDRGPCHGEAGGGGTPIRQTGKRMSRNLWSLAERESLECSRGRSLCAYMGELRREFEYSIVAAPSTGLSNEALEMARSADGMILVISAQRTRRMAALKLRNALGSVRLLGTVLSDREFPIPERIYRHL